MLHTKKIIPHLDIKIQDELTVDQAGVYKITFEGTGNYYIGSAVSLRRRIMAHLSNFRTGFARIASMQRMASYVGVVRFELITLTIDETWDEIREIELMHIKNSKSDPLCLNRCLHPGCKPRNW